MPLLIFALLFARFVSGQRVLAGVFVAGVDVGGATARELEHVLARHAAELARQPLELRLGSKQARLTPDELGISLAVHETALRALGVARNAGPFSNLARYAGSLGGRTELEAELRVDRGRFAVAAGKLAASLIDDPPFAGAVQVENGVARAVPPRPGRRIAEDATLRTISAAIALGRVRAPLAVSTDTVTPELRPGSLERALSEAQRAQSRGVVLEAGERRLELDPAALGSLLVSSVVEQELSVGIERGRLEAWLAPRRAGIEAPARDATFEVSAQDEVKVVPGAAGVKLSTEAVSQALWQAALRDEHRGELPLLAEPLPTRSTEQAQQLGIHRLVGAFTTRHPCCQPRVENIHRVATILDGLVVEPGKEVSVNALVGPRTLKNGFVLAPSIEDGEMVDTPGGGVSQFATTLFNALFRAGYEISERKPHTYWFPRYPMGIEATLSWPHPDIVFKNDTTAGLLVKTSFTGTTITVKLYGDVGGRRVSTSVSERRDIVQPTVELLPNRAVPPDEEKVKEGGMIGWSVLVERTVTFADGTKREDKRKVTYKPKPRRVDVHPCRIPKGEPGATGEPCPEPEPEPTEEPAAAQPG